MALSIGMVTIDCTDPQSLAGFWTVALDTTVAGDYGAADRRDLPRIPNALPA